MPSKIRVLDEHTINKIAAGEVIENPSSVVKELVENAVDAGAKEITIEIKGGGRQLIRITDNGCGMNRDDALLCLERHATSKIRAIDDIHTITTMGFRGEAVPSIASISKLTLLTCAQGDEEGTLLIVDGGIINQCCPAVRSPGTTFEVKSLFFNVPVRKKFQRSPNFDTNEILKVVSVQALAHPQIKFQLISNLQTILSTNLSNGSEIKQIGERICAVLGSEYFAELTPIDREHKGLHLKGYVGFPSHSRQNRTGQYLFINQRAVFSPLVSFAIKDAYGTSLPSNRHPIFVLFLTMDGSLIDVNVHPQKREVRLRQDQNLKEIITMAVDEALHHSENSFFQCSIPLSPTAEKCSRPHFPESQVLDSLPDPKIFFKKPFAQTVSISHPNFKVDAIVKPHQEAPIQTQQNMSLSIPSTFFPLNIEPSLSKELLKVIVSIPGYLILTSNEENVYLLDQRAAHSRILYEQMMSCDRQGGTLSVQNLLIPDTFDLPPLEAALLKDHLQYFNDLGLQIQVFGSNSFIIHGIPLIFEEANLKNMILEIIHELKQFQKESIVKIEIQKRISQTAGKAAVSHRKKLSTAEGQSLYLQLMKCQVPHHCPQGKPIMIELKHEEIEKQFLK
jgi:DNA mismatch repair protein MutL